MSTHRVVVFGVGNAARGDDGLGPALIKRIEDSSVGDCWWLTLVDDAQLQIEHALDLQINDLALFVDASVSATAPFVFRAVSERTQHRILPMTHALQPEDVVHTLSTIARQSKKPACFVLEIPASDFELSNALSAKAEDSLNQAAAFVEELLKDPREEFWRSKVQEANSET